MLLNPGIISLISGSLLVCFFALYAALIGMVIIRCWDPESGSDRQLLLERKTYLVATILAYLFGFQMLSLLLFIATADHIHDLFTGAMCAAGSLKVDDFGYRALLLKIVNVILCGVWMVVNYIDNRAYDYPLIKAKYRLLICIAGSLTLETAFLVFYFTGLRADVITSCCGTLFSEDAQTLGGEIAAIPARASLFLFFLWMFLTFRVGIHFLVKHEAARLFAVLSGGGMIVAIVSLISFISPYFYELPTHHCPFCVLQKEYGYIGYWLYAALLVGGVPGLSVGVMERYREIASLKPVIPNLQRKSCLISLGGFGIFVLLASYPMVFSPFSMLDAVSVFK